MKRCLFLMSICGIVATAALTAACGDPTPNDPPLAPQMAPSEALPPQLPRSARPTVSPDQAIAAFDDFPILWLGDSYDWDGDGVGDTELAAALPEHEDAFYNPNTGQEIHPALRSFAFAYGRCTIAPNRQPCPTPITILFYPPDTPAVPDEVRSAGPSVVVRGVTARIYNGGALWVETADVSFSIDVFASSAEEKLSQATRIANQLVGANPKAAGITKDSPFRAKGTTDTPSPSTATGTP